MGKTRWIAQKATAFIVALSLAFTYTPFYAVQASTKEEIPLEDKIASAVVLLQDAMQEQYEEVIGEVNSLVHVNGYDHAMTFESFMDAGNPYKDVDYIRLIAALSSANSVLKERGAYLDIIGLDFIDWSYEEEEFKEYKPYKVVEYTETSDGLYAKTGYHYSEEPETVGIYEEVDNPGLYRKTGEEDITPELKNTKYAAVTLKVFTIEDIIAAAGLDYASLEEDIKRREGILLGKGDNDSLRSAVFINLPDTVMTQAEWNQLFLEAIGYEPGHTVTADGETVAKIAATLTGQIPYEWGGKASHGGFDNTWWTFDEENGLQKGLDCSGFVQWAYITAGFDKSITDRLISTGRILSSGFERVDESELKPGDVGVVEHAHSNHCGIYAGGGKWFHSSSYNNTVVCASYHFTKFFRPISEGMELKRTIHLIMPGHDAVKIPITDSEIEIEQTIEETQETISEAIEEETNETDTNPEEDTDDDEDITNDQKDVDESTEEKIKEDQNAEENTDHHIGARTNAEITVQEENSYVSHTEDDVMLLAKLIHHEANNQGLNGWIAVGEVVRNRMESTLFPNTVQEVIYQPGQFTSARSLAGITPRPEIINVARSVLNGGYGVLNNSSVLYFRNAYGNKSDWGRHKRYTDVGAHSFYIQ